MFNGRSVSKIVVHPTDRNTWFLAAHSAGVWKTTNAGTTWTPIFDGEGVYSIGYLALDPMNPLTRNQLNPGPLKPCPRVWA